MNEETILEQKFGRENPFRVPEGYFSDFEKRLLENIPVQELPRRPLSRSLRPWAWLSVGTAAAVACGVALFIGKPAADGRYAVGQTAVMVSQHDNTDHVIDEVSDYAMLDNGDFYSYVSGE